MAPIEEQKDELESARNEVEREFKAKYNKTWVFQTLCKHVIVKLGFDPYKGKEEYQRFFYTFPTDAANAFVLQTLREELNISLEEYSLEKNEPIRTYYLTKMKLDYIEYSDDFF